MVLSFAFLSAAFSASLQSPSPRTSPPLPDGVPVPSEGRQRRQKNPIPRRRYRQSHLNRRPRTDQFLVIRSSDSSSSPELSDPTPPPADSGSSDQGSESVSESEPVFEPEPSEQDEYYYEDPNSYDDGTTENYYDPTTEESIVMVYPSGVTPSSSSSSSESSASSGEAAGAVANASSSAPPSSSNHTGRNLILIGVLLLICPPRDWFFVYSMFILPYLRKRKALQSGRVSPYAGASASGLAEVPAEAESDDFYEDAYGNRYRAEELPGFFGRKYRRRGSCGLSAASPASQGQQYLEEGPFAEELPYQSYQDNSEFSPVSYTIWSLTAIHKLRFTRMPPAVEMKAAISIAEGILKHRTAVLMMTGT